MVLLMVIIVVIVIIIILKLVGVGGKSSALPLPTLAVRHCSGALPVLLHARGVKKLYVVPSASSCSAMRAGAPAAASVDQASHAQGTCSLA
jgi:hypothetical protein